MGKGDGSFQPETKIFSGLESVRLLVAVDLNNDGKPDLAIASADGVSVMFGNGDGSFQPIVTYQEAYDPVAISVVDLNGDGYPDLALCDELANSTSILINKGDGSFEEDRALWGVTYQPTSIAAGDFNRDGKPDLVTGGLSAITLLTNTTSE